MTLSEFKATIKKYYDDKVGFNVNHYHSEIVLEVEYVIGTNSINHALVDLIYIDKVKHRVFYVGKSPELKSGWFSRKLPLFIKTVDFFNFADKKHKYDDYEVYFAWNYDYKDNDVFDYIPLIPKIEAKPSTQQIQKIELFTDSTKTFKVKARNLHEKLKSQVY